MFIEYNNWIADKKVHLKKNEINVMPKFMTSL